MLMAFGKTFFTPYCRGISFCNSQLSSNLSLFRSTVDHIITTVEPPLSGQPRSEGARILEFARISEITIISIA